MCGCSGRKSITISTTKLTSKSVGANAFARIYAKAGGKVPAKQLTEALEYSETLEYSEAELKPIYDMVLEEMGCVQS